MFNKLFKIAQQQGGNAFGPGPAAAAVAPPQRTSPPTRWEKAVVAVNGIVQQVSQIDPDGIDVLCFPGVNDHVDIYRNIKDSKGVERLVTAKQPGGPCYMGYALDLAFREAFARGFERPCSILVITSGRPDDHEQLVQNVTNAAKAVQKGSDLSVTFVQVGDDKWAEEYLKYVDDNLTCTSASGEEIDIVDTIKDEEIKNAVGEMKQPGFMGQGGTGAIIGAFAGAALGVGGMYMYSQMQAKKRTEGWNGRWRVFRNGEPGPVLTVTDNMSGEITIEGWPHDDGSAGIVTPTGKYTENEHGLNIVREPDGAFGYGGYIYGTVQDEHNISWSDGTHWEEVPPDGQNWLAYAGAGAAGAATAGAMGYLVQKKFFNKAVNKVPSDYVIIIDRSDHMTALDEGK